MQKCTRCKVEKPFDEFNKDKSRGKGYSYTCRVCASRSGRSYYENNRDKVLENTRRVYQAGKIRIRERAKIYAKDNPEKRKAKSMIRHALNMGRMIKPSTCSVCPESRNLDAHHDDYSQPLVIRWLCRSCHITHHKGIANA